MQNEDLFLWFPCDLDLGHAADTSLSSDFIKERHRSLDILWKQSLRIKKSNKFQNVQLTFYQAKKFYVANCTCSLHLHESKWGQIHS